MHASFDAAYRAAHGGAWSEQGPDDSSIAGHMAATFWAVDNGTKGSDSFAAALNEEIGDNGVSVACLKPRATETEFCHRAEMDDSKAGQAKKDDPADVAREPAGTSCRRASPRLSLGSGGMQVAGAAMMTDATTAKMHREQAEPDSDKS